MRSLTFGLGVVTLVFIAGTANAAGGGTSGGQSGKGSSEGRGGAGPAGGGSGPSGGSTTGTGDRGGASNPDVVTPDRVEEKKWEVGGTWETHRLVRQEDLEGAGANKLFNVLGAYGKYDLTPNDTFRVRAYLYERFVADQGETGFRFDDIILSYTRRIPLPQQFTLRAGLWATLPTSFASQKSSLVTAPRIYFDLEKKFGKYVTADLRASGDAYITQYRTAEGGNYNPKWSLRTSAEVEVVMPFHEPLSFGASVGTGYTWYYESTSAADTNSSAQANGSVADPTFSTQPISQTYSGEIFARYQLPPIIGVKTDALVAFANGDPSLGSQSVLHDGVGRAYFAFRTTAEVYGALTIRY